MADLQALQKNLLAVAARLKSFGDKSGITDYQQGRYGDAGLIELVEETLSLWNETDPDMPEGFAGIRTQMVDLLTDLVKYRILPDSVPFPRRYFYWHAYYNPLKSSPHGFIWNSLHHLYKRRGYPGGWLDPGVSFVRNRVEAHFKGFYQIEIEEGWHLRRPESINEAAYRLGCELLRLFFVEALSADLLGAWKNYEELEYLLNRWYRDHYVHLIYNFFVGCKIIQRLLPKIKANWTRQSGEEIDDGYLHIRTMRSWLLAALFHDIGYPAETLKQFRDNLQQSYFEKVPGFSIGELKLNHESYAGGEIEEIFTLISFIFTEDEFSFNFEKLSNFQKSRYYPERLIFGAMNALLRDQMEALDHGVMSAIFLLLTLKVDIHEFTSDSFSDPRVLATKTKPELDKVFKEERCHLLEDAITASLAIALHNLRQRVYGGMTIDFRTHPISYILTLVDDMQEWDRRSNRSKDTRNPFTNLRGFEVFPELDESNQRQIFDEDIHCLSLGPEGQCSIKMQSLFSLLKQSIKCFAGQRLDIEGALASCVTELRSRIDPNLSPSNNRMILESACDQFCTRSVAVHPAAEAVLRLLLMNLTNDVLTLVYVGGDPQKRGSEEDKVTGMWTTFESLFSKNLSHGPAVVFMHGYSEETVEPFFVAEYNEAYKCYVVKEDLRPKPR
jgi:hypothetical protein